MKFLSIIITACTISLFSCSSNKQLEDYEKLVDNSDKVIFYHKEADTFVISRIVDTLEQLQNIKTILKRNIRPEVEKKFIAEYKVEIYKKENLLGVFLISKLEEAYASFKSERIGFCFKTTYGIGMSL